MGDPEIDALIGRIFFSMTPGFCPLNVVSGTSQKGDLFIYQRVYHKCCKLDAIPVFVGPPHFNFHVSPVLVGAHL